MLVFDWMVLGHEFNHKLNEFHPWILNPDDYGKAGF